MPTFTRFADAFDIFRTFSMHYWTTPHEGASLGFVYLWDFVLTLNASIRRTIFNEPQNWVVAHLFEANGFSNWWEVKPLCRKNFFVRLSSKDRGQKRAFMEVNKGSRCILHSVLGEGHEEKSPTPTCFSDVIWYKPPGFAHRVARGARRMLCDMPVLTARYDASLRIHNFT